MSIKLKTENNQHTVTANGHKIIFDNLNMAMHYIFIMGGFFK
jgi:hypothetical protein